MNILSIPSGLCLSGNLPKLRLQAGSDVRIRLTLNSQFSTLNLLDETYTPDFSGNIALDLSELVHDALAFTFPDAEVFIQPELVKTFTLLLDDDSHEFTAIRAGVKDLSGTPEDFLMQNFLTAQEQFKQVTAGQPEWLTYYALQDSYLYITAYSRNHSEHIRLAALEQGKAYTINMQFDRLAALCQQQPEIIAAYTVATDSPYGQRLSCKQYYKCINSSTHQLFCFENSLGGLDALRCTGEAKTTPEYTPATAIINDRETAYRIDKKDVRAQNTGWLSKQAARWLQDMFVSRKTYILENNRWLPIILDENPAAETSTREDLTAFEFTCRPAEDKPYLAIQRIEETVSATWNSFINRWNSSPVVPAADWGAFINRWNYTPPLPAATWGAFINRWKRIGYNDYSHDYSTDYNITSPYLTVSPETVWLPGSAPQAQVQVHSNQDWTIE